MSEENTFDNDLCEENYQHNDIGDKKQSTKVLDYDLELDERDELFRDYDHILCEKCNRKIDKDLYYYYCKDCHKKETNDIERLRMEYGPEHYNEWLQITEQPEIRKHFRQDFNEWTSGNKDIDELIQNSQLLADLSSYITFEWIPYNKFNDIKYIAENLIIG